MSKTQNQTELVDFEQEPKLEAEAETEAETASTNPFEDRDDGRFVTGKDGYKYFSYGDGLIKVSRMIAFATHTVDKVSGNDIHHKNRLKWDDRVDNLQVMDSSEHRSMHAKEFWYGNQPYQEADVLREKYHENGMTLEEIADEYGVAMPTILYHMERHGIETRGLNNQFSESDAMELYELYFCRELDRSVVADKMGFSKATIRRKLSMYQIPEPSQK